MAFEKKIEKRIKMLEAEFARIKAIAGLIVEGADRGLNWSACNHWKVCWGVWNYNFDWMEDASQLRRNGWHRSYTCAWERVRFEEEWEVCWKGMEWCRLLLTEMAGKTAQPWMEVCICCENHYVAAQTAGGKRVSQTVKPLCKEL